MNVFSSSTRPTAVFCCCWVSEAIERLKLNIMFLSISAQKYNILISTFMVLFLYCVWEHFPLLYCRISMWHLLLTSLAGNSVSVSAVGGQSADLGRKWVCSYGVLVIILTCWRLGYSWEHRGAASSTNQVLVATSPSYYFLSVVRWWGWTHWKLFQKKHSYAFVHLLSAWRWKNVSLISCLKSKITRRSREIILS